MNLLSVLPLTVVMIAGPQIISAIFLASSRDAKRSSLAYLVGAGLAMLIGLTVWYFVFQAVRGTGGGQGKHDGTRHLIDWVVLAVLLALMVIVFARRKRNQPPKWMSKLQAASPRFAFGLGFLLFIAMPTDEGTMLAVAASLAGHDKPWWHLLPFLVLVWSSLPLCLGVAVLLKWVYDLPWANIVVLSPAIVLGTAALVGMTIVLSRAFWANVHGRE